MKWLIPNNLDVFGNILCDNWFSLIFSSDISFVNLFLRCLFVSMTFDNGFFCQVSLKGCSLLIFLKYNFVQMCYVNGGRIKRKKRKKEKLACITLENKVNKICLKYTSFSMTPMSVSLCVSLSDLFVQSKRIFQPLNHTPLLSVLVWWWISHCCPVWPSD